MKRIPSVDQRWGSSYREGYDGPQHRLLSDLLASELKADQSFLGPIRQCILFERDPYHSFFEHLFAQVPFLEEVVADWCQPLPPWPGLQETCSASGGTSSH